MSVRLKCRIDAIQAATGSLPAKTKTQPLIERGEQHFAYGNMHLADNRFWNTGYQAAPQGIAHRPAAPLPAKPPPISFIVGLPLTLPSTRY